MTVQSTFDFRGAPPKLTAVMARLVQLLAHHRRILVLDAASTQVQVGLLREGQPGLWHSADTGAGKAVFAGTAAVLEKAGLGIGEIAAFAYCEGPGSMLGVRTVAMTLRTWLVLKPRPVYSYQSLALAARHEWTRRPRSLAVIADARRDSWHCQAVGTDGRLAPLLRVPAAGLPAGELLTPANFRAWTEAPRPVAACGYDLSEIMPAIASDELLQETGAPDTFQHDSPDYKKWAARPHSAESVIRA